MLRTIHVSKLQKVIREGVGISNFVLPEFVKKRIRATASTEKDQAAKLACSLICENFLMAEKRKVPICQDTGLIVVMLEIGQDVRIVGGDIHAAVQKAVAQGSRESYLRNSVVGDPFERKNTGTNTPAIIHEEIVPGNKVKVTVMPKGGGAENMSFVKMLPPSAGIEGVENEIVDWVKKAGTNPCPPIIVGVGVGGNFEMCALLAKRALLRQGPSKKDFYRKMEARLLKRINALGIGPQVPQGGKGTALAVHVEAASCHIASLPLAVNINCHVSRYKEYIL